jgi:hypothetical protein
VETALCRYLGPTTDLEWYFTLGHPLSNTTALNGVSRKRIDRKYRDGKSNDHESRHKVALSDNHGTFPKSLSPSGHSSRRLGPPNVAT